MTPQDFIPFVMPLTLVAIALVGVFVTRRMSVAHDRYVELLRNGGDVKTSRAETASRAASPPVRAPSPERMAQPRIRRR